MYINLNLAESWGLTPQEVLYLQILFQSKKEGDLNRFLPTIGVDESTMLKYVEINKKGVKVLSQAGEDLLEKLQAFGLTKDDQIIADYLAKSYLALGKEVGNKKRMSEDLCAFRHEVSLSSKGLFLLIQEFLTDRDNSSLDYSQRADYLIFKPIGFKRKFDIHDSMLFQYYKRKRGVIEEKLKNIEE